MKKTKTSKTHVLILNLTNNIGLRRGKTKCCFLKSCQVDTIMERHKKIIQ